MSSRPAAERDIETNGVRLRVSEAGEGPLVILCHGWPESRHSWHAQLPVLAAAGYHAVAPDLRGYGDSDVPAGIDAYTIHHLVGDLVGLVKACGAERAWLIGHDFGAHLAWTATLLRPDIFTAVAAMSVPVRLRSAQPPLEALRKAGLDRYYWHYFQAPGVAEAEFERDVAATLRRILYTGSGESPIDASQMMEVTPGRGFLDGTIDPEVLPAWLGADELATLTRAYARTGFRGGLNWYRNIDRNWALLAPWHGLQITVPALFIGGSRDPVLTTLFGQRSLAEMPRAVKHLTRTLLIEGGGHWIQRERPAEVNAALLAFLETLK